MANIHPNLVAYAALLIWPVVALYLYARLPVAQATLWTILGGYLLLPVGTEIKFKMIPAFDKNSIPSLAALVGCALFAGRLPKFFRGFGLAEVLILALVIGPFITSMLNGDDIRNGGAFLPGVGSYDAGSAVIAQFAFILPFFLGRQFLRSAEDNAEILRVLAVAGLAYSLPMLFEVRMSPQLHNWIYGYYSHIFAQAVRDGGFRPMVFIGDGLLTAFFAMTTVVAAAALWRMRTQIARFSASSVTAYLGIVLVLCKTLAALIYGVVLLPLVRWATPRTQLRVAVILATFALAYPMLRTMDLIPTTFLLDTASMVSAERAASLETRFVNERQLLDRASERFWFGWGRYGRSRVFNKWGGDISLSDGRWIVTMGQFGFIGFLAEFALLALPIFRAASALRFSASPKDSILLAALALIVAINVFNQVPNASLSPWSWLLTGALLGRAEALRAAARQRIPLGDLKAAQTLVDIRT